MNNLTYTEDKEVIPNVKDLDIGKCFEETPPPLDFVMPGFLAGTVGGLVSPGGVGKSTIALLAAVAIADSVAGADLIGLNLEKHGNVVLWAGEDPASALHTRLYALGKHLNQEQKESIKKSLFIKPCLGLGADLMHKDWFKQIEASAEGSRLLIIDTLTRFHSLDENSSKDAKKIMGRMEGIAHRTGCAILFLHHVNKSSAINGMADLQQAARGSSVFVDNARWLSFVAEMTKEETQEYGLQESQRSSYIRFNVSKQNYAPPMPDKWLKRHDGGILKFIELEKKVNREGNRYE
mgnify:CR=1 FL=1